MSSSGGLLMRPPVVRSSRRGVGQNARVTVPKPTTVTKLTSVDGFVVVDIPAAEKATGIVRCARKILQDGAINLARSTTYAYASLEMPISGASAAVNADGEDRDAAVSAFVAEVGPMIAERGLVLEPGKGVARDDLATWPQHARVVDVAEWAQLSSAGIVAGLRAAVNLIDGVSVGVEDTGAVGAAVAQALGAAGADVTIATASDLWSGSHRVIVVGSKPGVIDHEIAATLHDCCIVGSGPLPITARGLAVARRNGCVVLPDFVTTAGPLLGLWSDPSVSIDDVIADVTWRIGGIITELLVHPDGPFLGGCLRAEAFLSSWTDVLPFGRPLA